MNTSFTGLGDCMEVNTEGGTTLLSFLHIPTSQVVLRVTCLLPVLELLDAAGVPSALRCHQWFDCTGHGILGCHRECYNYDVARKVRARRGHQILALHRVLLKFETPTVCHCCFEFRRVVRLHA